MPRRVIAGQFRKPFEKEYGGKHYHYFSHFSVDAGDEVVVNTVYGLTILKVTDNDVTLHKSNATKGIRSKAGEGLEEVPETYEVPGGTITADKVSAEILGLRSTTETPTKKGPVW